ncbi:hypothetical protein EJ02DRAFT_455304 [Clathrospora elynae]|uniref:Uncharacterized protein n=1 Tax=Clathrospora elynae TaxID=706981 RepID=A0A6A5SNF7_9PLEO|nr:hypothetical protein EJ02DRAFT_455304 [Clathrospora elynae]
MSNSDECYAIPGLSFAIKNKPSYMPLSPHHPLLHPPKCVSPPSSQSSLPLSSPSPTAHQQHSNHQTNSPSHPSPPTSPRTAHRLTKKAARGQASTCISTAPPYPASPSHPRSRPWSQNSTRVVSTR